MIWSGACSMCGSKSWRRSKRRNSIEWIVSFVILPFRCERCEARFYRFRHLVSRLDTRVDGSEVRAIPDV